MTNLSAARNPKLTDELKIGSLPVGLFIPDTPSPVCRPSV